MEKGINILPMIYLLNVSSSVMTSHVMKVYCVNE